MIDTTPTLGALPTADGTRFRVWAPTAERIDLVLEADGESRPMTRDADGIFTRFEADVGAGARYRYRLDGGDPMPDPASRFQPDGVHGPSQVVDAAAYRWNDADWTGVPQRDLVFYELHVGTFSPEGTYAGVRERLPYLRDLGITAIELMPLCAFPGDRNWGYDPASFFAPAHAYGTPDELRELVDDAHRHGLAMILDVVYNHTGPDGAYLAAFGTQLFTDRHHTPWGQAINLDGEGSREVRRFLLENALHWLLEYHFDGFRLDATFALVDDSPQHFLAELSETVDALPGPPRVLIAEDHRNLRELVLPRGAGGYGLDGVWSDDFHHQMRRNLAGDSEGYYAPYSGRSEDIAVTLEQGWFFTGKATAEDISPKGSDPSGIPKERFVICIQNHDQIGNRPLGGRLSEEISADAYRAASALLLLAPELPLLFMGQEWGTTTPFQYFTDHNEELGRLVSEGRRKEFADFERFSGEDVPDPQDPATFERSKLDWSEPDGGSHAATLRLYRELLQLRRELDDDGAFSCDSPVDGGLRLTRGRHTLLVALRPGVELPRPEGRARWHSEQPEYSDDPQLPEIDDRRVRFPVCGALLFSADGRP